MEEFCVAVGSCEGTAESFVPGSILYRQQRTMVGSTGSEFTPALERNQEGISLVA